MKKNRKGIVLAGGYGTRLYPLTISISKQLMPIYDKPMIYYPITTLMLADIKDILIITSPNDLIYYKKLLGKGDQWGININYCVQPRPNGIADAFIIGKSFIDQNSCALILGDNLFYGNYFQNLLLKASKNHDITTIFGYHVNNPSSYGVMKFNNKNKVIDIIEKPKKFISNYAVTGLYFYDQDVCDIVKELKPSDRGELEITDVNKIYIKYKKINVEYMGRGYSWLDTGSHETLLDASNFISTLQKRQGLMIGCPEEIAYKNGWIDKKQIKKTVKSLALNHYSKYLKELLK